MVKHSQLAHKHLGKSMQQIASQRTRRAFLVIGISLGVLILLLLVVNGIKGALCKSNRLMPDIGLKLRMVSGPFEVYSDDENSQYVIFKDQKCLVSHLRDDTPDVWETTHFENGLSMAVTIRDNTNILQRIYFALNGLGQDLMSYMDSNGDGEWDMVLDCLSGKKHICKKEGNKGHVSTFNNARE